MKGYFFLLDKKNSTTTFSDLLFAKSLIKLGYNIFSKNYSMSCSYIKIYF